MNNIYKKMLYFVDGGILLKFIACLNMVCLMANYIKNDTSGILYSGFLVIIILLLEISNRS